MWRFLEVQIHHSGLIETKLKDLDVAEEDAADQPELFTSTNVSTMQSPIGQKKRAKKPMDRLQTMEDSCKFSIIFVNLKDLLFVSHFLSIENLFNKKSANKLVASANQSVNLLRVNEEPLPTVSQSLILDNVQVNQINSKGVPVRAIPTKTGPTGSASRRSTVASGSGNQTNGRFRKSTTNEIG